MDDHEQENLDDYDNHDDHAHDDHDDHGESEGRVTAPMQEFGMGKVGIGLVVLLVGLVLTFGLAFGFVGF